MSHVPHPCKDCARLTTRTTRCHDCARGRETARNASQKRKAYRDPVYRSQPATGICWLCGQPGADTRDHITPLIFGSSTETRPAHRSCNSARGARDGVLRPHA